MKLLVLPLLMSVNSTGLAEKQHWVLQVINDRYSREGKHNNDAGSGFYLNSVVNRKSRENGPATKMGSSK